MHMEFSVIVTQHLLSDFPYRRFVYRRLDCGRSPMSRHRRVCFFVLRACFTSLWWEKFPYVFYAKTCPLSIAKSSIIVTLFINESSIIRIQIRLNTASHFSRLY